MRRPVDVSYWLDDRPPLAVMLSSGIQQAAIIVVLVYPAIILGREMALPPAGAAALVSMSLVVAAASTVLQSLGRFGIGAGYLAPACSSVIFIAPCVLAARTGGAPLVAGMSIAAGLATVLLARLLPRLRALLPPEVAGTVAIIVGIAVALTGVRMLARTPDANAVVATAVTLCVAVGLSVWGKGMLRWTSVLSALCAGTLAAQPLGLLHWPESLDLGALPLLGLPSPPLDGLAFDPALLPAFLVVALAAALKTIGLVTTLQKMNDADWVRPDPRSIAGGVTAEGLTTVLSGLLGSIPPQSLGITNITIQAATGVTSRRIAYATAGICLVLACFPRGAALLLLIPGPVLAGILLQAGGLMLVSGMQVATSRLLDARRSFAVGLALVAAIGVEVVPNAGGLVPDWLRPLMTATALGTLVAIGLNAVLRIGIRKQVTMTVPAGEIPHAALEDFVNRAGRAWGARPEVMARAADILAWSLDAVVGFRLAEGEATVTLGFDEFRVDLSLSYRGPPIDLAAAAPSPEELLSEDAAAARLAGHMIRRRADRASVRHRDGVTQVSVRLDH